MINKIPTVSTLENAIARTVPPGTANCRCCEKHDHCRHLCPEAEAFADQDNLLFPGWFSLRGNVGSNKPKNETLGLTEMETNFAPPTGNRRPYSKLGGREWRLLEGAGLSSRQAEVLFLYYWEAHSSREVAALLGLHHSAVDALLRRAKNRLRRHLVKFFLENGAAREVKVDYSA